MASILLHCFLLIMVYVILVFCVSVFKKRNDVADIAWGPGYVLVCVYLFFTQPYSPVTTLLIILVSCWGIRLSVHLYNRNKNKAEDYRYRQWREEWGNFFYLRSFLQVFLLQGLLLLIIVSPVMLSAYSAPPCLSVFSYAGLVCWLIGFYFQAVGDYQLSVFIKTRTSSNQIMQTGLWKYSRHPNYFGEIMMWWGIYIIVLPISQSIWVCISPLLITFLLLYVSGIPLLERKYRGHAAFEDYQKRTSMLIPMPHRKSSKWFYLFLT